MLYDNALLIMAYASVYVITKNPLYLDTAEKTAQYVLREMTAPGGGFYSAQDADSEGVEGKYYTFTAAEVVEILGKERGKQFADVYDITAGGNFEGVNIPNLLKVMLWTLISMIRFKSCMIIGRPGQSCILTIRCFSPGIL